jgi:quercetin dioxygenase-like cupin family protein
MHRWNLATLAKADEFFKVIANTAHSQVATMALAKGKTSGEYGTDHPHADQILIVLSGEGEARVAGKTHKLERGDVIVIEAGEKHQIKGTSEDGLRTINLYCPIAYPDEM